MGRVRVIRQVDQRGFTLIELMVSMAMGLILLAGLTSLFVSYNDVGRAVSSRTDRMADLYLASHVMQAELRQSLRAQAATDVLTNLATRSVTLPVDYPTNSTDFAVLPFWHATSGTLTYQDLDGNVGIFEYQRTVSGTAQIDKIYWLRPLAAGVSGAGTFQELMRDLHLTDGMEVYNTSTDVEVTGSNSLGGGIKVVLRALYSSENKEDRPLSFSFMIWPRN